jgi:adenine-specific DNA glycosylase
MEEQFEEEKTIIEAPKVKRTYKKKTKEPPVLVEKIGEEEEPPIKMPKPRSEKQRLQFMRVQARREEICLEKRLEKNQKIKEMVLKQLEIEKRNKALNKRKIMKISNSIIDDEFKIEDKEVLKKIIEKHKQPVVQEVDYTKFF